MGEEAPKIKRAAGLGIFQPVTDCKDDSYGRLEDEPKRYRPAQPANEILPRIARRGRPSPGLQPPRLPGLGRPLGARSPSNRRRGTRAGAAYRRRRAECSN